MPKFDPQGAALNVLTRVAGNPVVQRLGLDKTLERAVFNGARMGFRAGSMARKRFKPLIELGKPARLPSAEGNRGLFDITLSDEQAMFKDAIDRLVDDQLAKAARASDEACATSDELLQQIHDLGITMMAVPEDAGGAASERSPVTHTVIAEALGRADLGMALAALAPLGVANAITRWGTAEQQATYLPLLAGETFMPAATALAEPGAKFDPFNLACTAEPHRNGYSLDGTKSLVPLAETAAFYLVAAQVPELGPRLFIVEREAHDISPRPQPAMGLRAAGLGQLHFSNLILPEHAMLGGPDGRYDHREFVALTRVGMAAASVGQCQAVLDYVAPYVKERKAFGEPIAHRQSVAFMVANIAIELQGLRLLTWRAASRAEHGLDFAREATLAALQAADKGMEIGTNGVQLLGGHGFVKEHPVEQWYRNLRGAAVAAGPMV